MNKLSAVITAYNEERKIEECLKSVSFADEIVYIDNSSTDKSVEIAQKYTKKIFRQKNDPDKIDLQKNFGFDKATGDWILSIDADERVSKELTEEIKEVIKIKKEIVGYWIPRKNIIFGKWIENTNWYPDNQLRLFKKGSGRFDSDHVHEHLKINGETGCLKNHIIHENYDSINQFIQKTFIYAPNEASNMLKNGYKFSYFDAIRFPLKEFLSRFFAKEGYKDGFYGLMLSLLMSFYHFLVFAYIWEKSNFSQTDGEEFVKNTKKELRNAYKETAYWFLSINIKKTKNYSKKIFLKIKRKLL